VFTNGHKLIMDMGVDAIAHPWFTEHYDALLLGNLREDVYQLPFLRRFMLGKGLTHYYRPGRRGGAFPFVPAAPTRADWLFQGAVREHRAGNARDAFFTLGRVVHLLSEMVAPVHAQVILHWRGDPFEMYLEARHAELRRLPLPPWPTGQSTAGALVHDLAVFCQRYPCDRTRNVPGFVGWKLGLFRRPGAEEVLAQVHALVPMGAAYTAALYALFLERIGTPKAATGSVTPRPPAATGAWSGPSPG
jgi:hypothetical protein